MSLYPSRQVKADIDKFVKALERRGRSGSWSIAPGGELRESSGHCPVSFVGTKRTPGRYGKLEYRRPCQDMGISVDAQELIISAADQWPDSHRLAASAVRKRMVRALGIS